MTDKLDPASLTPEMLSKLLSASSGRAISTEQVLVIAEVGNLLSTSGTINLIRYTAFLAGESGEGAAYDE